MSTYVIGDLQGCFDDLQQLLKKIKFNDNKDKLIFCGDLVNRGGQSLEVLRWVYGHQKICQTVLGNHDLSLLAKYYLSHSKRSNNPEFERIFRADDCSTIMHWLLNQKLLITKKKYQAVIVHAGIYPKWSLKRAEIEARNIEKLLTTKTIELLRSMYGSKPNHWEKKLSGLDRARFAINSLTRMRFIYKNGGLNFKAKGEIETFPKLIPWFDYKPRKTYKKTIIFGHWSALGLYKKNNTICLDTGKVWGGKLTALKLSKTKLTMDNIFQV